MSLPSRPNRPNAGGLPGAPRPRPGAARPSDRPSESSSSTRTLRTQRSAAQLPSRSRPTDEDYDSFPSAPRSRSRTRGRDERSRERERPPVPSQRDSGYGSTTSGSGSAGSSFLDRMRVRSSETTPRTSIDDDAQRSRPARSSRREYDDDDQDDRDDDRRERRRDNRKSVAAQAAAQGDGSWIWGAVASAAGSLTLNINKAWATKVATYSGEETPPGEESRLTRAMKAYHLEKAQRPSDLPDWLFPESERRAPRGDADQDRTRSRQGDRNRSRSRPRADDDYDGEVPPVPQGRGLRDIYASAARDIAPPVVRPSARAVDDGPAPSRAANRLKVLRDAKRAAAGVRDPSPEPAPVREEPAPSAPIVRPRVGLPTGPGRARRP